MWRDPIVEEVRRIREAYASQFDFDLDAICKDLRRQQEEEGREVVSFPPKPARPIERIVRRPAETEYQIGHRSAAVVLRESDEKAENQDESA